MYFLERVIYILIIKDFDLKVVSVLNLKVGNSISEVRRSIIFVFLWLLIVFSIWIFELYLKV